MNNEVVNDYLFALSRSTFGLYKDIKMELLTAIPVISVLMKFLLVQEMSVPPHEYILVPFMMKCGDFDTTINCVKSSRRS